MPFILQGSEIMKSLVYRFFPVYQILYFFNYIVLFLKILIFFSFLNLIIIGFFLSIFFKQMLDPCFVWVNPLPVFFNLATLLKKFSSPLLRFTLQFFIEEDFQAFHIIPDLESRPVFYKAVSYTHLTLPTKRIV